MKRYAAEHTCRVFGCVWLVLAILATTARADLITVGYDAVAGTVTGTPFGLTVPLNTPINGYLTYDTSIPDSNVSGHIGDYAHTANGDFYADLMGTIISGSATPWVRIQSTYSEAFSFYDGPRTVGPEGGIMSVGGVPDEHVTVGFTVVANPMRGLIPDDSLPDPFPAYDFSPLKDPYTFSLNDGNGGGVLLRIESVTLVPEPATAVLACIALLMLGWYARRRRRI